MIEYDIHFAPDVANADKDAAKAAAICNVLDKFKSPLHCWWAIGAARSEGSEIPGFRHWSGGNPDGIAVDTLYGEVRFMLGEVN